MTARQAVVTPELSPPPEELAAYLDLMPEEIARLVLCILIEEMLRERLAGFRSSSIPAARVFSEVGQS